MASPTAHAEATPHEAPPTGQSNRLRRTLFSRELPHYPPTSKRLWYLFLVIAATVLLYYQLYIQGAVGPSILQNYGMSFKYYVYISVIGNVFGALASVVAGIADRVGRANIIAWGLGVTSVLDGFVLPHMPNKWAFAVVVAAVSAVEGLILVATPALVRDFRHGVLDARSGARQSVRLGGLLKYSRSSARLAGPVRHRWRCRAGRVRRRGHRPA
jgi:hypothetical protein